MCDNTGFKRQILGLNRQMCQVLENKNLAKSKTENKKRKIYIDITTHSPI